MRNAELAEIRALLRAQAKAEPAAPVRKTLMGGVKALLRKPAAASRGPLNLTPPVEPAEPAALELAAIIAEPQTFAARPPSDTAVGEAAPMLFLAPRRDRFGLADEGARPIAVDAPALRLRPVLETPDELQPRRRGPSLAATEAAGLGAEEILELHDMLSERLPQLLTQIDFEAKLAPGGLDEPTIAAVVAAAEAARAAVEQAAAAEAWVEAKAALDASSWDDTPATHRRRLRLMRVQEDVSADHLLLEGDLQAVRRARKRPSLAA